MTATTTRLKLLLENAAGIVSGRHFAFPAICRIMARKRHSPAH